MPRTSPPKDYYASVLAPGTKKIGIVSRRLGTSERLVQIAVVTNERVADMIVEALNHRQGSLEKLEAPMERLLQQTKEELAKQRAMHSEYHGKCRRLEEEVRILKVERDRAILARDAAQAKARTAAGLDTLPQG